MYILCMSTTFKLGDRQRAFFTLVDRAAFSNPFGSERLALDRQIAEAPNGATAAEILERTIARIDEELHQLASRRRQNLRLFRDGDRDLLRSAHLFSAFHRLSGDFDRLIRTQITSGDAPCRVPFAHDALGLLTSRGIPEDQAERYFAFFFQMRRAFFFIDRDLPGGAPCMTELRRHLWENLFTSDIRWYERFLWNRMEDFSTLLLGETGTGKGAAAAAIGRSAFIPFDGERGRFAESFTRNFVAINLSQFPPALIESELFGHKKGAFTGAIGDHQGLFTRCSPHGAIFLDEIGDVSAPVQIKLLQILQERAFSPVGSHERLRFQGRVIAATNRPLDELRRRGEFRDDFFYRLSSDIVRIPPLRQRLREHPAELDVLLDHVVSRTVGEPSPELSRTIGAILAREPGRDYSWPGNVRELEQAVRRILLTRRYAGEPLPPADLAAGLHQGIDSGSLDAPSLVAAYCALLYRRHGSYEEVARRTGLDRRTAKKHILAAGGEDPTPPGG